MLVLRSPARALAASAALALLGAAPSALVHDPGPSRAVPGGTALHAPAVPPGPPRTSSPPLQGSGFHVDERLGFKLKPPRGWSQIPLKVDEQWLVAKYLSDKTYLYHDPDTGWEFEHQPELMVIAFVAREEPAGEGEPPAVEEDEDGTKVIVLDNPYRDYEDYLDRTYSGGGFYVSSREEGEHGGLQVTRLEIKVEKLAMTGPKLISTWIYHLDGVDLAVQVEVLQDVQDKLARTVDGVLRSLKEVPRKAEALPEQTRTDEWITISMMEEGTPAQRRERRVASELQRRERARSTLPEGWTASTMGRCFVLNHTDERHAKKVVEQIDALLGWLDETLPFIGPDSYVREPIVRICADSKEHDSYNRGRMGGGGWSISAGGEIVTYKDTQDWGDWNDEWMNGQVFDHWFRERDLRLYWALPDWVRFGLDDYVGQARVKGKKLEFGIDSWIKEDLRELVRSGKASRPRAIIHMTDDSFWSSGEFWDRKNEAAALVHFFLSGAASRNRRTKDVFPRYLENLQAIIAEIEAQADQADASVPEPTTEEEEDAWYAKRREVYASKERHILEESFRRTFGDWTERDWDDFAAVYFESID